MTRLIAIDPGDVHVGVAFFDKDEYGVWYCSDAQEFEPVEFAMSLHETVMDATEPLEWIVFEKFRLYEDKALLQTGSTFLTSQLIGQIKLIHMLNEAHMDEHERVEKNGFEILSCEREGQPHSLHEPHRIGLAEYPADIKKPTAGILRHKGIKSTAKQLKAGQHCVDAEMHGYKHIIDTLKQPAS